jgi:BirA family biotin operon repressor/biotin-[acetyl-CoA-carboxylase] ligase
MYLSLAWQFAGGVEAMAGLSLAVGAAVAGVLEEHGLADVRLKWPNDLLHEGAKLGGILVETSGHATGVASAVVGIGINLRMPDDSARDIDQRWTDVEQALGMPVGRNALLSSLLNGLLPLLAAYEKSGFGAWRQRWLERHAHTGQQVTLMRGDSAIAGVVVGIDEFGALLLDVGGTVQPFSGGELSLRAAP